MWQYKGQKRPDFANEPGPGQESVWDFPRPPIAQETSRSVEVFNGSTLIARTSRSYRLMETASPPTFYLPPEDVDFETLARVEGRSICEWKGLAQYWGLKSNPNPEVIGWSYPEPRGRFAMLKDYLSFYPGRLDCRVDGEQVLPQPGLFYGGWITSDVVGPFKGEPNTGHW